MGAFIEVILGEIYKWSGSWYSSRNSEGQLRASPLKGLWQDGGHLVVRVLWVSCILRGSLSDTHSNAKGEILFELLDVNR